MLRSCKQSSLIVINRTASRESVHQMARPIPSQGRPVSRQTSRATCQSTIMHDWWHDPAWLVARSNTTSYDLYSQVQSFEHDHRPCCDQICSYDHPRLLRSIARFVSDLSAISLILWSYIGRNMFAWPVWLGLKRWNINLVVPIKATTVTWPFFLHDRPWI